MRDDALTNLIIGEAIAIHRTLGPGLLESACEAILADALEQQGLRVERQLAVPIRYRNRTIAAAYRLDLLVDHQIVVEIKSIEKLAPIHSQQLLTYLRLGGFQLGLLLNFGAGTLRDGLKRLVNNYAPTDDSPLLVNRARRPDASA
jgi:GxxExxY protein